MSYVISILIFLLIFGLIVFSHEFGHFAMAKRNGIRVNEFMIGMGPKIVSWRRGETLYSLRLLPVGGACVFDGLDDNSEDEDEEDAVREKAGTVEADREEHTDLKADKEGRQESDTGSRRYYDASVGARIATTLAGPFMNFLLGFVLACIIVAFSGTDLPVVQSVMEDSAAEEAGLLEGDVITRINGRSIHIYREVSLASMMNYGEPMTITYERDGVKNTVTLVPKYYEEDNRYYIGLSGGGEYIRCNALQVFQYGWYEAEYWVRATFDSLGLIFRGHFSRDDLTGPVGVVQVVNDTYNEVSPYGSMALIISYLELATLLSINVGILNLLPLPALDGGRLLFQIIEAVRGKPVPREKEGYVHLAGAVCLIVLMVLVMFNDITRFFR